MRAKRIEGKNKIYTAFWVFKSFFIGISIIHLAECAKISRKSFLNFTPLSYIENHTKHALRSLGQKNRVC